MNYNISNLDLFPIILSKKFIKILKSINNTVSIEILKLSENKELSKESFIDITDSEDIVSFMPSDRINKMISDKTDNFEDICWSSSQRIETRIGRLVYRLLGEKVQGYEIENFVNEYKSIIKNKKLYRNFKLIKGEEIKKWYSSKNYAEGGGNLKDSCMRHEFCQRFLDFYTKNPDKIRMLILLDENKEKILGRSLIWKLDRPENEFFMDRIYYSSDFIFNMFINQAIKNKWLYRLDNMENLLEFVKNDKKIRTTVVVKLKDQVYDYFPFLDNLAFYDPVTFTLSNNPQYFKTIGSTEYYDLCDARGDYEIIKI